MAPSWGTTLFTLGLLSSKEPISHLRAWGLLTPRWSVVAIPVAQPFVALGMAFTAGLRGLRAWVCVGPP